MQHHTTRCSLSPWTAHQTPRPFVAYLTGKRPEHRGSENVIGGSQMYEVSRVARVAAGLLVIAFMAAPCAAKRREARNDRVVRVDFTEPTELTEIYRQLGQVAGVVGGM